MIVSCALTPLYQCPSYWPAVLGGSFSEGREIDLNAATEEIPERYPMENYMYEDDSDLELDDSVDEQGAPISVAVV